MAASGAQPTVSEESRNKTRWAEFLQISISVSRASAGALWIIEDNGEPSLFIQQQLGEARLDQVHHQWPGHQTSLEDVVKKRQTRSLEASFEQNGSARALQLLLFPIVRGEQVEMILELFLSKQNSLAVDEIEASIRQLLIWATPSRQNENDSPAVQFAAWLSQIHKNLSLSATCFAIANETVTWSGWDRVSVLVRDGRRLRLEAVSGVDVLDRRSTTVRVLERMVNRLTEHVRPTISDADDPSESVKEYQNRIDAHRVAVFPLSDVGGTSAPIGVVVVDQFEVQPHARGTDDLKMAMAHLAPALEHALLYEQATAGPLKKFSRTFLSWPFARTVLFCAFIVGALYLLTTVETNLVVKGTGFLEPRKQQDVFANANGLIETLHVAPGEWIEKGGKLITLRSPDLEFEMSRLSGEMKTTRQQIDDLDKLRTDPRRAVELRQTGDELAARAEELKAVEKSLQQQLEVLERQAGALVLRSPISGTVTTWDIDTLLAEDRPVNQSDRLLSVANLKDRWIARLNVDHRDIGPVLAAYKKGDLTATFVTAEAPEVSKTASVFEAAPVVKTDAISGTTLVFKADVDRKSVPDARPGTTILYRLHCGHGPIGYVWFRRLVDRVQAWWALL